MSYFVDDVGGRAQLRDVYARLQDEKSRWIYRVRSLCSLTDEEERMRPIVRDMVMGRVLFAAYEEHKGQDLVLFGAGRYGRAILRYFPEIPWTCVVDNFKAGQTIGRLPVVSLAEVQQRVKHPYIVNALQMAWEEIDEQLHGAGFQDDQILSLGRIAQKHQYFDLAELPHDKEEAFVDIGAFNGASSQEFVRWAGTYVHIYAFEPVLEQQELCRKRLQRFSDVTIYPYGLGSKREEQTFYEEGEGSHQISSSDAHRGGQLYTSFH